MSSSGATQSCFVARQPVTSLFDAYLLRAVKLLEASEASTQGATVSLRSSCADLERLAKEHHDGLSALEGVADALRHLASGPNVTPGQARTADLALGAIEGVTQRLSAAWRDELDRLIEVAQHLRDH